MGQESVTVVFSSQCPCGGFLSSSLPSPPGPFPEGGLAEFLGAGAGQKFWGRPHPRAQLAFRTRGQFFFMLA